MVWQRILQTKEADDRFPMRARAGRSISSTHARRMISRELANRADGIAGKYPTVPMAFRLPIGDGVRAPEAL